MVQQYVRYILGDNMKLNNKGMTLMELLVSIVLVGIVLTFLFQLLTDLQHETENNNYAYNNQVNRTDAIYTIEKDLQKYTLVGVKDASTNDNLVIEFHYIAGDGTKTTTLKSDFKEYTDEFGDTQKTYYLRYTDYNNEKYSWEMKGAILDTCGTFKYFISSTSDNYYFKLNIPVYNKVYNERNNKDRNNAVDDIEITFADYKRDLRITNGAFLTGNNEVEQQIGICTN